VLGNTSKPRAKPLGAPFQALRAEAGRGSSDFTGHLAAISRPPP